MADDLAPASFRVCEAPTRDVGRGLIRLDPEDMARLGVEVGDVVSIRWTASPASMPAPASTSR